MALSTVKISELSFHNFIIPNPLRYNPSLSRFLRRRFLLLFSTSSSLQRDSQQHTSTSSWIQQWNSPDPHPSQSQKDVGGGSIDRIVHRLRNLGLGVTDDDDEEEEESRDQLDGSERLGDLLERNWNRPDTRCAEKSGLPWEKEGFNQLEGEDGDEGKRRRVRAPWLAELTMEDSELRRLRKMGMTLRERISVPKAGLTESVMEKILDGWRKSELVRLKFHEALARDMKTAHKIVEVGNLCFMFVLVGNNLTLAVDKGLDMVVSNV